MDNLLNEYIAVEILNKSILFFLNSTELDLLAQLAHFQERKLKPEKSMICLRSHSTAKTIELMPTDSHFKAGKWQGKSRCRGGGYGSSDGQYETAIL